MSEDTDRQNLKKSSIHGAAVNFGSQLLKFGLTFLNQVILARLLLPKDFGLLAMVAPIISFVQMFTDLGLSQATIQRKEINQQQLSYLFWLNVAAATVLALVVIAISPLVGWFYHEPRVVPVTAIMGAIFILSGLTSQHLAIFTRNLQFAKMVIIDLCSFCAGMGVGILMAAHGFGYWSLVISPVVMSVISTASVWIFSPWRPSRPKVAEEWQSMLRFGGNLTGFNVVNYFARNLDNILIGRVDGEASLGIYDRAYKLLLMPITQISQPISRVAMPLLSRMQDNPEGYRQAYLRMVEIVMILTYPSILFAITASDHLIRIVMGDRWAAVAPIFAVLGFGALFQGLGQSTGWLFISQGRTQDMRNWGIFNSCCVVASFCVGLHWGPLGVAISYIGTSTAVTPILWWLVTRKGPVTLSHMLNLLKPFAIAAVPTAAIVYLIDRKLMAPGILSLFTSFVAAHAIFLAVFFALPSGRAIVKELWRHSYPIIVSAFLRIRFLQNRFAGKNV